MAFDADHDGRGQFLDDGNVAFQDGARAVVERGGIISEQRHLQIWDLRPVLIDLDIIRGGHF